MDTPSSVLSQHVLYEIAIIDQDQMLTTTEDFCSPKWSVEVFACSLIQLMLIYEQHIMLEASVKMRLQAQVDDDGIVVAVDVCVYSVEALEELAESCREMFREGHADAGREDRLVVNI